MSLRGVLTAYVKERGHCLNYPCRSGKSRRPRWLRERFYLPEMERDLSDDRYFADTALWDCFWTYSWKVTNRIERTI
jgi:hypothetical protein